MSGELVAAIQAGATRNLYVAGVPENVTAEDLSAVFGRIGQIESVRVMRIQGNGYVNYTSVESAVMAREQYQGVRALALFPNGMCPEPDREIKITFTTAQQNCRRKLVEGLGGGRGGGAMMGGSMGRGMGGGGMAGGRGGGAGGAHVKGAIPQQQSRSIYVGNLPHGVDIGAVAELAVPYGLLESVKFFQTYAFLNFVDEAAAAAFWQGGQPGSAGLFLRGRSLLVNWGRPLPTDQTVWRAIERGATRHLAVGPTNPNTTQAQVAEIIAPLGEIETVHLQPDRGFAIVNMLNISSAISVKDALHGKNMGDFSLEVSYTQPFGRGTSERR